MDNSISDLLSNYCDQLIGIATESNIKKEKKKKKNLITNICKNEAVEEFKSEVCESEKVEKVHKGKKKAKNNNCNINNSNFLENKKNEKNKKAKKIALSKSKTVEDIHVINGNKVTNDGFKVVTDIPPDDSDISDAFESDIEESEKDRSSFNGGKNQGNEKRMTDDGFKVRYEDELPSDDSDLSDAFIEDEDKETNEEGSNMTEDGFKIRYEDELQPDDSDISDAFSEDDEDLRDSDKDMQNSKSKGRPDASYKVNKLLQGMIDDFDLDENALQLKKNGNDKAPSVSQGSTKKTQASKLTFAAKQKSSSEVTVIDYATKRGGAKKDKPIDKKEILTEDKAPEKMELPDEREFKRARFEVFKFGMGGFNKEKKRDTRVALAIKLGAKPPKKKAINYKDLQVKRKDERIQKKEDRESKRKMGLQVKKPATKKRIRDTNRVGDFDTQVGRFDGGVVRLSKNDIDKIKRKR